MPASNDTLPGAPNEKPAVSRQRAFHFSFDESASSKPDRYCCERPLSGCISVWNGDA
jgi:hypothetical protein